MIGVKCNWTYHFMIVFLMYMCGTKLAVLVITILGARLTQANQPLFLDQVFLTKPWRTTAPSCTDSVIRNIQFQQCDLSRIFQLGKITPNMDLPREIFGEFVLGKSLLSK